MKKFKEFAFITLGDILVAMSIKFFLEPNRIAAGGTSGIAIIIHSFFSFMPVGVLMIAMDAILFTIAMIVIGSKFGFKTLYASFCLSGSLILMDKFIPYGAITKNLLLAAVFGTFLSAIGMGIIFNQNASTGGTDIVAKIINKFLHIDIGKSLLLVDFIVTLFAGMTLGADIGMYSLLSVIINGFMIDFVIEGLNVCKQVMVISSKSKEISRFVMEELDRGCTVLQGKGGYTLNDTYILYCVLNRSEFIKLKQFIRENDASAFITVSDAREVLGNGFKDIHI
ncbi:YitT family protein [Clostridium neuense]|uniref:YitT family protein n=1 Tax=Clostridium neuense TaxID=1728934 RepID=A0ABW8T988_9CLOT